MSDESGPEIEIEEPEVEEAQGGASTKGTVGSESLLDGAGEAPMYDRRDGGSSARHKRAIFSVPVQVVVSVGRAQPTIGELLNMRRDALLQLDTKLDDPVDIMVGKRVIARGELQELEGEEGGRLGVRLTEIVDLSEPF